MLRDGVLAGCWISRLLTSVSEYASDRPSMAREADMRGSNRTSGSLFSYVDLEERIPAKHPLPTIREIVNEVLASLDGESPSFTSRLAETRWRPNGCCGPLCVDRRPILTHVLPHRPMLPWRGRYSGV